MPEKSTTDERATRTEAAEPGAAATQYTYPAMHSVHRKDEHAIKIPAAAWIEHNADPGESWSCAGEDIKNNAWPKSAIVRPTKSRDVADFLRTRTPYASSVSIDPTADNNPLPNATHATPRSDIRVYIYVCVWSRSGMGVRFVESNSTMSQH